MKAQTRSVAAFRHDIRLLLLFRAKEMTLRALIMRKDLNKGNNKRVQLGMKRERFKSKRLIKSVQRKSYIT